MSEKLSHEFGQTARMAVGGAVLGAVFAWWHPVNASPKPITEHATHALKATPSIEDAKFNTNPDIIQLKPALPNPEGDQKISPTGITIHWWGYDSNGNIHGLEKGLRHNKACGDTGCSVQYAVTDDGKQYRMMESGREMAYHASGGNSSSIGIEIEGAPEDFAIKGEHFNLKKYEGVVSLAAELVDDYDIPIEGPIHCGDVVGIHAHQELNKCGGDTPFHKTDVDKAYLDAVINGVKSIHNHSSLPPLKNALPSVRSGNHD